MQRDPGLVGETTQVSQRDDVLNRPAAEVVRVLHADRPGRHQVRAGIGGGHLGDHARVQPTPVGVPGACGHPAEHRVAAELGPDDMGQAVTEQLPACRDQQPDTQLVAHRARGHEQSCLVSEKCCHA